MRVHEELRELQKEQSEIKDGTRLFHDGSIKTQTLTGSGSIGWYILAGPVQGAGFSFKRYFPTHEDGMYLNVTGVREAISIRDGMLSLLVEARVQRQQSNDLRNQV